MSETKKQQLADLRRSKAQWDDDPDQHSEFPLNDLVAELEKKVGAKAKETDTGEEG